LGPGDFGGGGSTLGQRGRLLTTGLQEPPGIKLVGHKLVGPLCDVGPLLSQSKELNLKAKSPK